MNKYLTSVFLLSTMFSYAQNIEIYVSDAGNFDNPPWQILKFDQEGKNPSIFINQNLNWPQDILFLEDTNEVLISNLGSGCITKYNAISGAFIDNFACAINGPTRTKIGPDGLLYVLQWTGNGKVKRYNLDGSFVDDFTSTGVSQSIGLDWDLEGNLYVSSYNGKLIRKFDELGKDVGVFINSNLLGPTNIWFDANGDLLVSDYKGTAVKRFDGNGNYIGDFISGLKNSEGYGYLPNGNILIGNGGTQSVKMYDSNGSYIKDIIASETANLLNPNAITIKPTTPSVTEEVVKKEAPNIIYPKTGTLFFITEEFVEQIRNLTILDSSGRHLALIDLVNESSIDVQHLADGSYFIIFNLKDGTIKKEKIVVAK